MAALGAAISLFFFHGENIYIVSLIMSLSGGLLIALLSKRSKYLEAVIGLIYALGLSGAFILLSKSAHGMEKFNELMAYDILFTEMSDVYMTAIFYLILGIAILFINKFTTGFVNELLFFLTFAVTVTSSVKLAGVLVVFAILLAPAFISIQLGYLKLFSFINRSRLLASWIIGVVLNTLAIYISHSLDFPTGYTLVFVNALAAVMVSIFVKTA
jgi:zinc/manganese transport system permease protein